MNEKLLRILACPVCKSPVEFQEKEYKLVCVNCKKGYGFKNCVPVMLSEESKDRINNELQMVQRTGIKSPLSGKLAKKLLAPLPYYWPEKAKRVNSLIHQLGIDATYLDIGSRASKLTEEIINLDVDTYANVNVVGDAHNLPFLGDTIDCVFIMQVLEHVKNPKLVVKEIFRVLRKKGYVFAYVPFLEGFHTYPGDFQRFSITGTEELFSEFEKIENVVAGGPASTVSWVLKEFLAILCPFSNNKYVYAIIREIAGWLTCPIKYMDIILAKKKYSYKIANGFFYLGRKL